MSARIWLHIASELPIQAALAGVLGRSRLPNGPKATGGHLQQAAHRAGAGRAGGGRMATVRTLRLSRGQWTPCMVDRNINSHVFKNHS